MILRNDVRKTTVQALTSAVSGMGRSANVHNVSSSATILTCALSTTVQVMAINLVFGVETSAAVTKLTAPVSLQSKNAFRAAASQSTMKSACGLNMAATVASQNATYS